MARLQRHPICLTVIRRTAANQGISETIAVFRNPPFARKYSPMLDRCSDDRCEGDSTDEAPSPSIQARVDTFSTDSVRAQERFSYWRDAVCSAVFGISIEAPPEGFTAR